MTPPFRRALRCNVGATTAFSAVTTSPTVLPIDPYYHSGIPRAWHVKHGSALRHFGVDPFAGRLWLP